MEMLSAIGLALPAGLNAYIPLLAVAVSQRVGLLDLREPYSMLGEWWAIALVAVLLAVEMLADKFPAVDSVNDAIQTVIRPATGAVLMVGVSGQAGERFPVFMVIAGVVLAGGVHAVKAASRPAVNAGTAGIGAPFVSAAEDLAAALSSAVAILVPVLVVVMVAFFAWLVWRLLAWRARQRSARGVV